MPADLEQGLREEKKVLQKKKRGLVWVRDMFKVTNVKMGSQYQMPHFKCSLLYVNNTSINLFPPKNFKENILEYLLSSGMEQIMVLNSCRCNLVTKKKAIHHADGDWVQDSMLECLNCAIGLGYPLLQFYMKSINIILNSGTSYYLQLNFS